MEKASTPKDDYKYEHAYMLHRLGRNKEALAKLKTIAADEQDMKYSLLMSQITYKLYDYGTSSDNYSKILQENFEN